MTKDFLDKDELKKWQEEKTYRLLRGLKTKFYPKSENLDDFPIINKKIFMNSFDEINTVNITLDNALVVAKKAEQSRNFSQKIGTTTIGLSSGTSGSSGVFLVNDKESAIWVGYILKKMLPRPLFQRHKIAFFLRANSNLYESVKSLLISFSFYDLIIPLDKHIDNLNEFQPSILIAPAQVLRLLAKSNKLNIQPKKIISVAEVLEEDDKKLIEQRFSQKVHQIYQCTEGFLAHTCEMGNLHLNEDNLLIEKEWIDKKSGRFFPIITDFNRTTQPVIRYKLDDILVLDKEPCSCGSVFTRLKKIEGRADDILKMKDLENNDYLLFPDFIRRAIITVDVHVDEYSIVKKGNQMHIYLKPLSAKDEVEKAILHLYTKHGLKKLIHSYHEYEYQDLNKKRRRIQEK